MVLVCSSIIINATFEVDNMLKQQVLLIVLTLLSLNILFPTSSENVQLFRYTKAVCSSSNITVIDYYCYVKALSRTLTTLSSGGNFIKNHTKIYVKMNIFVGYLK